MVRFKIMDDDPQGEAIFFVISVVAALDKLNASSVINEPEQCTELILKLMKKVDPPAVKKLLLRRRHSEARNNGVTWEFFAEQLAEYSAQVNRVNAALAETSKKHHGKQSDEKQYGERKKFVKQDDVNNNRGTGVRQGGGKSELNRKRKQSNKRAETGMPYKRHSHRKFSKQFSDIVVFY